MDDFFSELRGFGRRIWDGRSLQPHHRRRRGIAIAAALTGAIALIIGISTGSGSSTAARHAKLPDVPPGRPTVPALAGVAAAEDAAITRTLSYTPYVRVAGAEHRRWR